MYVLQLVSATTTNHEFDKPCAIKAGHGWRCIISRDRKIAVSCHHIRYWPQTDVTHSASLDIGEVLVRFNFCEGVIKVKGSGYSCYQ